MASKVFLNNITIPAPCKADWNSMIGNDQVRFCQHCNLDVHNLSTMSRNQAERLIAKSNGGICVRYVRDPMGRLATLPVTQKLHRISKRATRLVAGAFTATLSISSVVAQSSSEPLMGRINRASVMQPLVNVGRSIAGTITDENGALIVGATIFVRNKDLNLALYANTNEAGQFKIDQLPSASFEVRIEAQGFAPYENQNVYVGTSGESRIDRTLRVARITETTEICETESVIQGGAMVVVSPEDPFIRAAQEDNLEELTSLISGIDVNARDAVTHTTALEHAVQNANREMVQLLLSAGASVNARNSSGETVLMMIDSDATSDLIWDLINAGGGVNLKDDNGNTPLMRAASVDNLDALRALLEAGAKVNERNNDGSSALMQAASEGYVNVVRALVVAGADINLKDKEGNSPLDRALDGGHSAVVRFLKSKGAFETKEEEEKEEQNEEPPD